MTQDIDDELLDRPIRDFLSVYRNDIDGDTLSMDDCWQLFGAIHPADAGRLLRDIEQGIDREGFTAQGTKHPDFQSRVKTIQKEPFNRDGSEP